jgi:hypothetical protein
VFAGTPPRAYFPAAGKGRAAPAAPAARRIRTEEILLKKLPFLSPLFVLVLIAVLAGCGEKVGGSAQAGAGTPPASAASNPAAQPAAQPAQTPNAWQGTVAETMDSGGYTYVLLDIGTEKIWCATTATPVKVGDKVTVPMGQMMTDFRSATLDRVFPEIYFTTAIWKAGSEPKAGGMPAGHPGMSGGMPGGMPGGQEAAGGAPMGGGAAGGPASGTKLVLDDQHVSGVAKASGGYRVGEIFDKGSELNGKVVKVRGRVVKFTPNIMGTNWLHIQDGTGEGATVDLTVTSSTVVAVGDVVVAEGTLAINKDFGAGYKYAAIVEKANVTKE